MTVAIISDIHGNWEALREVFRDIESQGIETIYCLGDIVGYGPDPQQCIDEVRKRCTVVLRGNHEDALLRSPIGFHRLAREAIAWTKRQLLRPWPHFIRAWRNRAFLRSLPRQAVGENCRLVHGSPRDPTDEYLLDRMFLLADEEVLEQLFSFPEPICFCGHTHLPSVFSAKRLICPSGTNGHRIALDQEKLIVNVGSVGQPRDRDPRSCYVEYTGDAVIYHRVPYDVETTQAKILHSGLDGRLAERLFYGL